MDKKTVLTNILTLNPFPGGNVKRKELLELGEKAGLGSKDLRFVFQKKNRSKTHGEYSVASMLQNLKAKELEETRKRSESVATHNAVTNLSTYNYDALPYTEDDIAEELNLMGTYL